MKTLRISTLIAILAMTATISHAKTETLIIKSSMVCGMCEDAIINGLAFEKGIKRVKTDVPKNLITIKYNPKKISADEIRKKISELGYAADDVPAKKEAHDALPGCCQQGSSCDGDAKKS